MTLRNPQHELFAQEIAKGKSAARAYVIAGYKEHRQNASGLARTKPIQARVAEILAERASAEAQASVIAVERLALTKEKVLSELAKIGFANMADYMKATPEGDPYLDFSALTRDQSAALAEVTVEDFIDGRSDKRQVRRVKFKLHDKKGALVDIGRELGMFIARVEVGQPGEFDHLTDEEAYTLAERSARLLLEDSRGCESPPSAVGDNSVH